MVVGSIVQLLLPALLHFVSPATKSFGTSRVVASSMSWKSRIPSTETYGVCLLVM